MAREARRKGLQMPWQLEISTIDVGQGDSSLIIARNPDTGQLRSMLIDAGLAGYGSTVHDHVQGRINVVGGNRLDHVLVSHYDVDHVGGVVALLQCDNLSAIARCLAQAAVAAWDAAAAADVRQQVAAAAAAAAAAAWGGYAAGVDRSGVAVSAAAKAAKLNLPVGTSLDDCARAGVPVGQREAEWAPALNPRLIKTSQSCTAAAMAAAGAAYHIKDNLVPANRVYYIERATFDRLRGALPGCFSTGGLYRSTHVIDAGDRTETPDLWANFIAGEVPMWSDARPLAPGVARRRGSVTVPSLGSEVLWGSGPNAVNAPAGAPAVFLVTGLGYVWGRQVGPPPISGGQVQNDVAIGVAVRFGNFFYFTAGDLPAVGEELAAQRLLSTGFPNPQGGSAFAPAHRFAAFKVGHHGSAGSTSANYLAAINARSAFISCGKNKFGKDSDPHPTQAVIDRLNVGVPRFYLTNCKYTTVHVPASDEQEQLVIVGNRSRVCGDNADVNLAVGRYRGDSLLYLDESESTGTGAPQQFHVRYWEHDDLPHGGGRRIGLRVEDHPF